MTYSNTQNSINLKGITLLFNQTLWCSVIHLLEDKFPQQTPMPMLYSTPDATSHICHSLLWQFYPVASAGCANRPLPLGVGSFKLQLQSPKQMSCLPQSICDWSCNLKGIAKFIANALLALYPLFTGLTVRLTNPDAGVAYTSFLFNTDLQQLAAADSIQ